MNNLNKKYIKQKIENEIQTKEIKKQNKLLNDINNDNNFTNSFNLGNNNYHYKNNLFYNYFKNKKNNKIKDSKDSKEQKNNTTKNNIDNLKISHNSDNNNKKDKFIINNEILLSNLKLYCNELKKINEKKDIEINELKKNIKCSNYNELLREKEIYQKEMIKLKKQLDNIIKKYHEYKKHEEENKKLIQIIKQKDTKIKSLETQIKNISNSIFYNSLNLIKEKEIKENNIYYKSISSNMNKSNLYTNKNSIFYQLYIEMKKRGIHTSLTYINKVLNKLEDLNQDNTNKIIVCDCIINLFKIKDINSKNIVLNFANKEFDIGKNLKEIKMKHIRLFDELFNQNNKLKSNEDIYDIIKTNINIEKFKKEFIKLDKEKKNYIEYNQMINIINEYKLNDITEEILLLTKDKEIFNKMNYNILLDLLNQEYNKDNQIKERYNKHYLDDKNNKNNLSIIKCNSFNIINYKLTKDNNKIINEIIKSKEDYKNNDIMFENNEKIDILKNLSLIIKKEQTSPESFLSSLKKSIEISKQGEEKKHIDIIEVEEFNDFLISKSIQINNKINENILLEYQLKNEEAFNDNEKYLNYSKIISALQEFMKSDESPGINEKDLLKDNKN